MERPSGDQAAPRSCAPGEPVRLRVLPFSAGTVSTSPRATNSARLPSGDRPNSVIFSARGTKPGRAASRSAGTWMATFVERPAAMSPPFSYTMPPGPPLAQRAS